MSDSIRTQILKNIKSIIETINFGESVKILFCSPEDLELKEIPALTIEFINSNIDYTTIGYPREKEIGITVDISCIVKSRLDLFLKADEMITKVEEKLSESRENVKLNSLNGVVLTCEPASLEYRDYSDLIENCGGLTLTLNINYTCQENNLREVI